MKRKTRTFSLLLTLAAFLLPLVLLTGPARAAWAGDGDGSAADPYQISNVSELVTFRDIVNDGETDACAVLTADIDLNGSEISLWAPIGDNGNRFSGVFDGQGYTVKGLYVDGDLEYAGLFGCVGSGGTVKNLNVEGTVKNARASGKAGGVVGYNKGTVENCRSAGTVSGSRSVGGVVGSNDGTVKNCRNAAAVSGSRSVGGVVGENSGTVENIGTVESCRNTGTVSGTNNVGGVVGDNTGAAPTVKNCCNTGTVSGKSDSITPSTGGVVGYVGGGSPVVENCYNTGAVSSKSSSGNPGTGGVVGYVAGATPRVENCCNVGAVSSKSAGARIGGVVGCVSGAPVVKNCYNGGTVPDSGTVGGVVGHKDSGDMSGVQDFNDSLTAAQFADASSFPAEWFSEDGAWRMGGTRPLLKAFDNATAGTWAELADALRWDGTVTLTADVTAGNSDGALVVPAGADVTLDLNDHCVLYTGTGSSPVITLDGGALTLADRAPEKTARFVTLDDGNGRATAVAESGEAGDGCLAVTGGLIAGGTGHPSNYGSSIGGGVYVEDSGAFIMEGGTICGNAANGGGGVYVMNDCAFTMTGGTITGNTARSDYDDSQGGGVYVLYSAFTMTGGEISGNDAPIGGGVYVDHIDNGTFNVSGAPVIGDNPVVLNNNASITVVGALTDGKKAAELWVDAESGAVVARGGKLNESDDYVLTDADAACFHGSSGNVSLVGAPGKDNGAAVVRLLPPWAALQARFHNASTDADAPTEITLAADVTAGEGDGALVVPAGRYVTLDLNGHTIDRGLADVNNMNDLNANNGYVLHVAGTLTLTDGSEARTGAITGGNNGTYFVDAAPGGVLVAGGGTLTMNGGAISGNKTHYKDGGGVYVANGGTLTMNGGAISGNSAAFGGGVCVADGGAFELYGGTISGNSAALGGGVYVAGAFVMSGGSATGNNGNEQGGGVYVAGSGTFAVSGAARVTGNFRGGAYDASNGVYAAGTNGAANNVYLHKPAPYMVAVIAVAGPLDEDAAIGVTTANSGAFTSGLNGSRDDAAHFKSDREGELILINGDGEAVSAEPILHNDGDITAPVGSVLVLAVYDGTGRLNFVRSATLDHDCINVSAETLLALEPGYLNTLGSYKLMLLDGKTYAPLCKAAPDDEIGE